MAGFPKKIDMTRQQQRRGDIQIIGKVPEDGFAIQPPAGLPQKRQNSLSSAVSADDRTLPNQVVAIEKCLPIRVAYRT